MAIAPPEAPTKTQWWIEPAERGLCVGMTQTGKSTLNTENVRRFRLNHPPSRVLIIDSKPRYRAEYLANGMGTYYRNWVKGDVMPDSVAVTDRHNLYRLYLFTNVVILQSCYQDGSSVRDFHILANYYAEELFRISSPRRPTLLVIDELYDLLTGGLAGIADRPILRAIRQGAEKNMAVLTGSQRPRSIPVPVLTEATRYYIFFLEYEEDKMTMRKHGPKLKYTPVGHDFVFYHRKPDGKRVEKLMKLELAKT